MYDHVILLCWCLKTGNDKRITFGSHLNEFIYQVLPKLGNSNNVSKVYQCYAFKRRGKETTMIGGEKLKSI